MSVRFPVFIVGSPRSGTSILVDALLSAGYHGFREGSFLSLITAFDGVIDRHFNIFDDGNEAVLVANVDKTTLKRGIFRLLRDLAQEQHPQAPWLDKTGNPEMILAVPVLRTLWPDCAFVFAKRRAIENVISRLKKFPQHTFEYHCTDWARNMSAWRSVREGLPDDAYVEIDQQGIIQSPEQIAQILGDTLSLAPPAVAGIGATLKRNRPQQTASDSAARLYTLSTTGWSDRQREVFLARCGAEMTAWGYSTDETYSVESRRVAISA